MATTLQFKMVTMMVLPIRLKMQKRTGKPTPILLITTGQEWEVLYSPIQSKAKTHHLRLFASLCCLTTSFASFSVRYNLLSRTRVPEVPQLPSENRIVQNPPALRITVAFLIKTEEEIK